MLTSPLPLATRGRYVDDTTTIKLLRNGSALTKSVSLGVHQLLVPESSSHRKTGMRCPDLRLPSYYIVGGLVFCTLCEPYLRSEYGEDSQPPLAFNLRADVSSPLGGTWQVWR